MDGTISGLVDLGSMRKQAEEEGDLIGGPVGLINLDHQPGSINKLT